MWGVLDEAGPVRAAEIRGVVRALGLGGGALEVHASLRSFGRVEGGARTVVDALLDDGCTVLVPAFSNERFAVPPPPHLRPARNGWDYARPWPGDTAGVGVYTPAAGEIDRDMGAIPAAVVATPGRARGDHPLSSFAAAGPQAAELVGRQGPLALWSPLAALADADGLAVLMGVGLTRLTLLHLAEQDAGRRPFLRWANGPDGAAMAVEVGGCSAGFANFAPVLRPLMREATVGRSPWLILPARPTLAAATEAIRRDPAVTHCPNPACARCHDAALGGPAIGSWS